MEIRPKRTPYLHLVDDAPLKTDTNKSNTAATGMNLPSSGTVNKSLSRIEWTDLFTRIGAPKLTPPALETIPVSYAKDGSPTLYPAKGVLEELVKYVLKDSPPGSAIRLLSICLPQDRLRGLMLLLPKTEQRATGLESFGMDSSVLLPKEEHDLLLTILKETTSFEGRQENSKGLNDLVKTCSPGHTEIVLKTLLCDQLVDFYRLANDLTLPKGRPRMSFKKVCEMAVQASTKSGEPHPWLLCLARRCNEHNRHSLQKLFINKDFPLRGLLDETSVALCKQNRISNEAKDEILNILWAK